MSHALFPTPALTAFLDDLEAWSKRNPNIQLVPTITDSVDPDWRYETGRVEEALMARTCPTSKDRSITWPARPAWSRP